MSSVLAATDAAGSTTSPGSTPPDRTIHLPPSPPASAKKLSVAVSTALGLLRLHKKGGLNSLWNKTRLSLEEYGELWRLLKNEGLSGYVEDKVRYDYDPDAEEFTVRMTTPTHDLFIAKVVNEIQSHLATIGSSGNRSIAGIARNIEWQNTTRILLSDDQAQDGSKYPRHSPDAAFRHSAATYSRVVIEVSYSQKRKDLSYLADNYILGSRGSIGVVIGLDIEYQGTKEAKLLVWRPKIVTDEDGDTYLESELTVSEVFRNKDGKSAPGGFALKMRDFSLPEDLAGVPEEDRSQRINISYDRLTEYLCAAESAHQFTEQKLGRQFQLPAGTKLRKRKRTPTPPLSNVREEEFEAKEEAAKRRMDLEDGDFKLPVADVGDGGWGQRLRRSRTDEGDTC